MIDADDIDNTDDYCDADDYDEDTYNTEQYSTNSTVSTVTKLSILVRDSTLTQYKIAGICGIHPTTFSEYIRDLRVISPDHLVSLCNFFQVEPETVIGNVGD